MNLTFTTDEHDREEIEETLLSENIHRIVRHVMRKGDRYCAAGMVADLEFHIMSVADHSMARYPFEEPRIAAITQRMDAQYLRKLRIEQTAGSTRIY